MNIKTIQSYIIIVKQILYYLLYYITGRCISCALLIPGSASWPVAILAKRREKDEGHRRIKNWETDTHFVKAYSMNFA